MILSIVYSNVEEIKNYTLLIIISWALMDINDKRNMKSFFCNLLWKAKEKF